MVHDARRLACRWFPVESTISTTGFCCAFVGMLSCTATRVDQRRRQQHHCCSAKHFISRVRFVLLSLVSILSRGQPCLALATRSGGGFNILGLGTTKPQQQQQQQQLSTHKGVAAAIFVIGDPIRKLRERFGGEGGGSGGGGCAKVKAEIVGGSNGNGMAHARAQSPNGGGSREGGTVNGYNSFIAGGLAGSIATTITCPIEVRTASSVHMLRAILV